MAASSPTTFNNIYLGEKYDCRMESDGSGGGGANAWSTLASYYESSQQPLASDLTVPFIDYYLLIIIDFLLISFSVDCIISADSDS